MANEQLRITTYNCKHFYDSGDKFDFINKLMRDSEFYFYRKFVCMKRLLINY